VPDEPVDQSPLHVPDQLAEIAGVPERDREAAERALAEAWRVADDVPRGARIEQR
jgi:hypothetical protein